jgi:outer membrane protein OmpA-like peptidoglycan-associated protein
MLYRSIVLFLYLLPYVTLGQNLILNGGFEDYYKLPEKDGCFNDYIKDWSNLNGKKGYPNATPDFLHKKGTNNGKSSSYYYGEVDPYAGDGMMGVIVMPDRPFYEYVSSHVSIQKGKRYEFSMYINNGVPKYCAGKGKGFGVYFSKDLPNQEEAELVQVQPQWMVTEPFYLKQWENIKFRFTAPEDFEHLTIGYFLPASEIQMSSEGKVNNNCIYFFVDEISLTEIQEKETGLVNVYLPKEIEKIKSTLGEVHRDYKLNVSILVKDKTTGKTLEDENVSVINLDNHQEIMFVSSRDEHDSKLYSATLDPKFRYGIFAKKDGYIDESETIEPMVLTEDKKITKAIELSPIKKGEKIVLKNIYFDSGKSELLPASFIELDKLSEFLLKNQAIQVEISGHTDSDGADAMNMDLSQRRAQSVVQYLQKTIPANRMKAKGYGKTIPIAPNTTPEGKQLNRRVEFKIL